MSEERFDRIDGKLQEVDRRFDAVDQRFDAVDQRFSAVDQRLDELDRHMHVLYEDVIARIAAIPDNASRLEAKIDRGFTDLKEAISRRLDPLEAAVRQHSTEIERLKQGRA
jgi:septation ring formation regulator EzrA